MLLRIEYLILDSVVFDNSYSVMRNKKIHYNIRITEPKENLQELALKDI